MSSLQADVDELAGPERSSALANAAFSLMVPVVVSMALSSVSSSPSLSFVRSSEL